MRTSTTPSPTRQRLVIGPLALTHPFCGPNILYKRIGSDPISSIVVSGPAMSTTTYTAPTFPFSDVYGSFSPTIIVHFTSGSGSMRLTRDYDSTLVTCETYEAPYLSPLTASVTCTSYTLTITHNGNCD
jgi:hypothetical protein